MGQGVCGPVRSAVQNFLDMPCVFCQRDVRLTLEHVFPQWMQPWLADPEGRSGTHTRTEIRAGMEPEPRSHSGMPATLTVRSVCAECNNGWMSQLETRAQPLLETMLRGNARAYYDGGRTTLATWIVKTALVAGSRFRPPLRREFYDDLCAHRRPSNKTVVWIAATNDRYMHYTDYRPIKIHDDDVEPPEEPNAYCAVLSVGEFAGFVVSWLDGSPSIDDVAPFHDALVPIWPHNRTAARWPPRLRLDFDGLEALAETIVSTGLVQSGLGEPITSVHFVPQTPDDGLVPDDQNAVERET
jgi:hypothetical protein